MSASQPPPTEEELRAAYEAELKQVRVEHLLLEHVVTMVNLGMRRTGLSRGTEDERDPEQVRLAIEAIRAVLPLLERVAPAQLPPIRDALSQLQLTYVKIGGSPVTAQQQAPGPSATAGGAPAGKPADEPADEPVPGKPGEPGPAQRSGRLWVPGS